MFLVPSAPPQDVSITMPAEHNDTAQLSWEAPPHEAHNGIIQGYQVEHACMDARTYRNISFTVLYITVLDRKSNFSNKALPTSTPNLDPSS